MSFIPLGQNVEVIQQMRHVYTICGYLVFFLVKNTGVFVVDMVLNTHDQFLQVFLLIYFNYRVLFTF